jgi:hypothetical protein
MKLDQKRMKYVKLSNTPQFSKLTLKGNFYSSWTTSTWVREINYFETSSASKLYITGVEKQKSHSVWTGNII